ncbi:hypothetical protein B9W68_30495 [Streptomyces sp. CS227]|uniref:hypothetical protein n=1 Tax=Streptomyces sp. CS227 TaxID=1982763 RepID=UPI000B422C54|nr:hypothetical protein [Streptomyces sp. CS227]OWA01060.1 hypothetical protein B9W68_30495 [Streptomyces sp. CS227]
MVRKAVVRKECVPESDDIRGRYPASTAVERSDVLGEVAAASSTNWSWATIAASRAAVSSSVLPKCSRIAYLSVIMWSTAVRTAESVISTHIATSGRVTWERVWWLSRRSDWISSASAALRTASPRIHIVRFIHLGKGATHDSFLRPLTCAFPPAGTVRPKLTLLAAHEIGFVLPTGRGAERDGRQSVCPRTDGSLSTQAGPFGVGLDPRNASGAAPMGAAPTG